MSRGEGVTCEQCGVTIDPETYFCRSCGSPVEHSDSAAESGPSGQIDLDVDETVAAQGAVPRDLADFQIEEEISRGGMGIVFRATDPKLDREVAIKVITPELASDKVFRKRFISESRLIASLDNQHILPIYQTGEGKGTLFLVTKLVAGGDLSEALARRGKFPAEEVVAVVSQIGDALDAAHAKGLVHRDVKPANILLDSGPAGAPRYLLSDFGVATKVGSESGLTNAGEILGTVDYMAPEQIEGRKVDGRADVYALGCVAMELLSGSAPFKRDSKQATLMAHLHDDPRIPASVDGANPNSLAEVFGLALAKDPAQRFSSCGAFSRALEEVVQGDSIPVATTATEPVVGNRVSSTNSKSPVGRRIALAAAGLLAVAAGAAGAVFLTGGLDEETPEPDPSGKTVVRPPEDPGPGEEPPAEEVPAEPVVTRSLEEDAEAVDDNTDNLYFYGADEWDDGTTANQYPAIGNEIYDSAVLIEDGTSNGLSPSKFEDVTIPFSQGPFSEFKAAVGLEPTYTFESKMTLEFLLTDGTTGEDRGVWGPRTLIPAAEAIKVSFPIEADDTRMIIRVSAPLQPDNDDEIQILVLGNPTLVKTGTVEGS